MKLARWSLSLLFVPLLATNAWALSSKVTWKARLDPPDARAGESAQVVVEGTIEDGWHIYSIKPPVGEGPRPTKLEVAPGKSLTQEGSPVEPAAQRVHDPGFNKELDEFPGAVAFGVPVKLKPGLSGAQSATVTVKSQACKEGMCLPPHTDDVPVSFTVAAGAARPDHQKPVTTVPRQPAGYKGGTKSASAAGTVATPPTGGPSGGSPSGSDDSIARTIAAAQHQGLLSFLWLSFTFGFLALLTPCVFPMVPITVSFFSKQHESGAGNGVRSAVFYCLGIISTFTGIGVLISVLFGAGQIQKFAAHPITNLALAILFIAMALNLFGVFEIVLPGWLIDKTQGSSQRSSVVGPMLMGLTFTITSFTCTFAFVGTLLVTTTQGNVLWPILGMLAFSTAFSLPFFLLALFPRWLGRLPKSGGWLVNVKAFMGFIELAAALKFLSSADLVWQLALLTRPVFLAIWFAIFVSAGCHLLGWLRLPHDHGTQVGLLRRAVGVLTIAVGVLFLAGMNGVSLGKAEGFVPPELYPGRTQSADAAGLRWIENYDAALAEAKAENKPIFIDFTGVTCSNCRVMEKTVFQRPEVVSELKNFVTARLYTDKDNQESNRYQQMQAQRYGQTTLPLYIVLSPGEEKKGERAYDTNAPAFVDFLRRSRATSQMARGS